jgi:hypothetical protein
LPCTTCSDTWLNVCTLVVDHWVKSHLMVTGSPGSGHLMRIWITGDWRQLPWLRLHWVMAAIVDCSACLFQIENIENHSSLSCPAAAGPLGQLSQWSIGSGTGTTLLRLQTLSDSIRLKEKIGEWPGPWYSPLHACLLNAIKARIQWFYS